MAKTHKSNRSLAKRIKVTSTGKVIKRRPNQNHFNAKDSGSYGLQKRGTKQAPSEYTKQFHVLLPTKDITHRS